MATCHRSIQASARPELQQLARTSSAGTAYSADAVFAQLKAPAGQERYIYDRLAADLSPLGDLTGSVDEATVPEVDHDSGRAVRRTLKLQVVGNAPLNPLHDLIRPHYQLRMPDGGWIDFVLGTFAVLPGSKIIGSGATQLTLDCADVSQLLVDATFVASTGVAAGQDVVAAVAQLVANYGGLTPLSTVIPSIGKKLLLPKAWEYGISPLVAVNDLLASINYFTVAADEQGRLTSALTPDWNLASPAITFDTRFGQSRVIEPFSQTPDFSKAFNVCIVVVDDPANPPAYAVVVENHRADSPVSIENWHRKMGPVIKDSKILDRATAQARGLTEIQQAASIYAPIVFDTLPWPAWQDQDVLRLVYQTPDEGLVDANHVIRRWTHRLQAGAPTTHTATRIVPAGP